MLADSQLSPWLAGLEPQPVSPAPHVRRIRAHARLSLHPQDGAQRPRVEAFIRSIYLEHYGARIRELAPTLVALQSGDEIVAAAGYRAATGPLFLERYLAAPIERCVQTLSSAAPARATIVEVGHLASSRNGAGRLLMPFLGAHLAEEGYEWVVSTATEELHQLFRRLGLAPLVLGTADPSVLGSDASDWGSYYDHRPQVLAGSIRAGMAKLTQGHA